MLLQNRNVFIMKMYKLSVAAILLAGFTACVPARKFEEVQAKQKQQEEELKQFKAQAETCDKEKKDIETELGNLKSDYKIIVKDTTLMGKSYRTLTTQYDHMERLNKEIMAKLRLLQDQAELESASLSNDLTAKELELQRKSDELTKTELRLSKLELELNKLRSELDEKAKLLAEREKRVNELEELLKQKDEAVNALKDKVANALLGFKDKGLTVEERNGKVYVSLDAKLLFATGSTKVSDEGKKALVELAKVLQDQKDMEVVVEGHTDSDKLSSSNYPHDNWELSVLRATSVVKIMTENSTIDPKILSASGRSEFLPVSDDKAKNRRIEIILTPNLDELYKLLNNN